MADSVDIELGRWAMERINLHYARPQPIGPYLSALLPLQPDTQLQRRWYVVQTESQRETDVAKRVYDLGMDTYHPREPRSVRISARRRTVRSRPMIIGYLFVGFDLSYDRWQMIPTLQGVMRLLMFELKPIPIPNGALDYIQQREAEAYDKARKFPPMPTVIDDWVQIIEHASFAGLFGRVIELFPARQRLRVELDFFGRLMPIELAVDQVRVIGKFTDYTT